MVFASTCEHASSAAIFASSSSDQICLASSEHFKKYREMASSEHFVNFYFLFIYFFHTTIKYIKGTVCLRPQIAKANRGGRSF